MQHRWPAFGQKGCELPLVSTLQMTQRCRPILDKQASAGGQGRCLRGRLRSQQQYSCLRHEQHEARDLEWDRLEEVHEDPRANAAVIEGGGVWHGLQLSWPAWPACPACVPGWRCRCANVNQQLLAESPSAAPHSTRICSCMIILGQIDTNFTVNPGTRRPG